MIGSCAPLLPADRRACSLLAAVLTALVLTAWVAPARAKPAQTRTLEEARRLFYQGEDAYKDGRFEEALESYASGYALAPRPGFLINMAQAQRALGRLAEAHALLRQYLREEPGSARSDDVVTLLAEIRTEMTPAQRAAADRPAADPDSASGAAEDEAVEMDEAEEPVKPDHVSGPDRVRPMIATVPGPANDDELPAALRDAPPTVPVVMTRRGPSAPDPDAGRPFFRTGWFWAVVGTVVVAAGVTVALAAGSGGDADAGGGFQGAGTWGALR